MSIRFSAYVICKVWVVTIRGLSCTNLGSKLCTADLWLVWVLTHAILDGFMQWMKLQWESVWTVCLSTMKFVLPLLDYVQPLILLFARAWSRLRLIAWMCMSDFAWSSTLVVRVQYAPLIHLSLKFFRHWILSLYLVQTQHYWALSLAWHLAQSLCCSPATPLSGDCNCIGSPISGRSRAWPSFSELVARYRLQQWLLRFSS